MVKTSFKNNDILECTQVEILADSINENNNRITTFRLVYPRIIHAELLTHRVFSRNSASSRAIPFSVFAKNLKEKNRFFWPIYIGINKSGMQASEYCDTSAKIQLFQFCWENLFNQTVKTLEEANEYLKENLDVTYHKQLINRPLEAFQLIDTIVTATDFENFFDLRCSTSQELNKNLGIVFRQGPAQPEFMELADKMKEALNNSKPNNLKIGQWHIPYLKYNQFNFIEDRQLLKAAITESVVRCAKISYGRDLVETVDFSLYDKLLESRHLSPFEHVALNVGSGYYSNFKGFKSLRSTLQTQFNYVRI